MNNILVIIKKELKRFFGDKRMLLSLFIPGILIYVIYGLVGNILNDVMAPDENHEYKIVVVNEAYDEYFKSNDKYNIIVEEDVIPSAEIENGIKEYKDQLSNKEIDLLVVFQDGFLNKMVTGSEKPWMEIYYNSTSNESNDIFIYYATVFSSLGNEPLFYINNNEKVSYDLATKEDTSAKLLTMLLPYVLIVLLFTGCLSIASESIAGEKERGTIATLLVTPTKRSSIAIGKIIALSITSFVSASVSFLGLILSLPRLLGGAGDAITLDMYEAKTYILIFLLLLVTVLLFTTILTLISTIAKSIKEASSYSSVIMIIVTLLGITSMMGNIPTNPISYLIPIYNIVSCMSSIFSLSFDPLLFTVTILSNLLYVGCGIFILTKLFNSERIMFAK